MARVLVVDDEPAIRRLLRQTLERAGHDVIDAADARTALAAVAQDAPDAVLLDLGLPGRDGLELVPVIARTPGVALLVVSARDTTEDKVAALDLGADDYVTKPFDSEELLARLRVALRRSEAKGGGVVRAGEVSIDPAAHRVERAGAEVHLTRKEYEVLTLLADHAGRVVTHKLILQRVWGGHDPKVEYLRIVIRNLRQKLEAPRPVGSLIANEQGIGYRLIG
ncbi:DNA-binding response regulator [Sphingomonas melonis TY]|jgi:two-component system, OmpR family, KDP operon response regulator KdpE|uniref:DNA-binding response regulator n=2 Tax=Sphingomonas TaxID=13687 RepID=A0A175Y740_9SPHN|nr:MULTISPECIES: response regulator transcription factor [Sphingomonas]AOW24955.1 DNA-binding response regulator [Sphingomonas melonis TY]ATI57008.1 DNA-binding response regulator [Sphingomonas melonis]KZB96275.1 DNA-binding response regulator [Sphingomonas melonis TY]MBI0533368.1 DNA-binding response regulator [Sphingomonas sp. TX0522]MBX8845571.1 response regulator transcription factor [Sphingomonas melonis]